MKNKFSQIKNFKKGHTIKGFYLCKNINFKITRLGDEYVDLFLEDSTGVIRSKIWSNINYFKDDITSEYPVAIKGKVISFNDNLEIDISFIKSVTNDLYDKYGYNEDLLFKYSNKETEKKFQTLLSYANILSNNYKTIIKKIFKKYKDQILSIPSENKKYSFRGGFLFQLVALLELNAKIHKKYSLELDKTIAGIILKNIGLVEYYENDLIFTINDEKKQKGFKLLGLDIISNYTSKKNIEIIDFLKKNIINDDLNSSDIYMKYIVNIYTFDSKIII